jgi:sec-independent protein translocase protein TatB
MLKKVGSWIGVVKKYISNIQNEVADLDLDKIDTDKTEDKNNDKT